MNKCQEFYQSLWSTHVIRKTVQNENSYHLFGKNIYIPGEIVFVFTGICKFLLNNLCVDIVLTNSWALDEVIL